MAVEGNLGSAAEGAAAGSAATFVMSAFMFLAQRLGLMGQMPPKKITSRLLHRAGAAPGRKSEWLLTGVAHVAFGAVAGAVFATVIDVSGQRRAAVPLGVLYGAGVWGFSYTLPIPALRLMPPPHKDRPGRPQSMLIAHFIYGSALGAILARSGHKD